MISRDTEVRAALMHFDQEIASLEKRRQVVAGLHRGFRAAKHLSAFGARIHALVKDELKDYTVSLVTSKDTYHPIGFRVWGNGIDYNCWVDLTWFASEKEPKTWQENYEKALTRFDYAERIELMKRERDSMALFEPFHADIARKLAEIREIRSDAFEVYQREIGGGCDSAGDASHAFRNMFALIFDDLVSVKSEE